MNCGFTPPGNQEKHRESIERFTTNALISFSFPPRFSVSLIGCASLRETTRRIINPGFQGLDRDAVRSTLQGLRTP